MNKVQDDNENEYILVTLKEWNMPFIKASKNCNACPISTTYLVSSASPQSYLSWNYDLKQPW